MKPRRARKLTVHHFRNEGDDPMITATEALQLPSAQLTDEEKQEAERCLAHIEDEIREKMKLYGVDNIQVATTNRAVAAEITVVLVQNGWTPQWRGVTGGVGVDGQPRLIAYLLNVGPSEKAHLGAKAELAS